MDTKNANGQHRVVDQGGALASTEEVMVETRPDGTLTVNARMPLHVNANDIPAIRVEHELLPEGGQRDRFYLAEDAHVDFLVDARGEVSFCAQNVSLTISRQGVVTFALKG